MKTLERKNQPFVLEVAQFFASAPTREEILEFRPSKRAQERAAALLLKLNAGKTNLEEEWELDQFQHLEELMRLIKAKARERKAKTS
jgi:hypothetical protein